MRPDRCSECFLSASKSGGWRMLRMRPDSVKACRPRLRPFVRLIRSGNQRVYFKGCNTLVKSSKSVHSSSLRSADQFSHRDSLQRLTKAHKRLTKGHKGWREKWPLFLLSSGNQGVLTLIGTAFMKMRFTQNKTQRTFLITFINRRNTYALGVQLCRRFGGFFKV